MSIAAVAFFCLPTVGFSSPAQDNNEISSVSPAVQRNVSGNAAEASLEHAVRQAAALALSLSGAAPGQLAPLGDLPAGQNTQDSQQTTKPPAARPVPPSLGDLGFSPEQVKGNPQEQAKLDRRSRMLKIHQRLGLITAGPLVATVITGGFAGGRNTSSTARDVHAALGSATGGLYFATAYYSIFAPKVPGTPTRGPIRFHKILAWIHGPGMVLTPVLGVMAFEQKSRGERVHGIASAHGPVGVVTAAAYGLAIASVSIKF